MHAAAQAYTTVAKQTASPRELEANLLLKAAARLQAIKDSWDGDNEKLADALIYNRKLWAIFLSAATANDNPLPPEIRQNIANLGIFVMSRTVEITADPRPDQLTSLITINRELAAGLRNSA